MKKIIGIFVLFISFAYSGIRHVNFDPSLGSSIEVKGNSRIATLLRFPSRIFRVFLGSPSSWSIKVVDKELVIRPRSMESTGLIVELETGEVIPIRAHPTNLKNKTDDVIYVDINKDFIQKLPGLKTKVNPPKAKEEKLWVKRRKKAKRIDFSDCDFSYKWKNSKRLKIKAVFDDGVYTYIVYFKDSAVGAVYINSENNKKEIVNFVLSGNVCKVGRRLRNGERFVVVYGKETVKIKRKKQ